MIEAKLRMDGTLEIVASNEVELYALQQWERQRKNGNAKLVVVEKPDDVLNAIRFAQLATKLHAEFDQFKGWLKETGKESSLDDTTRKQLAKVPPL